MVSKTWVAGTTIDSAWLQDVDNTTYKAGIALPGSPVVRTQGNKNLERVSVKDYGAIGTAVPGNVTLDNIAFSAAAAASKEVHVPEGTYYLSGATAGYILNPACSLIGAGAGKTIINYTGPGNGIYMGQPGNITFAYLCTLKGITLNCTNRASTVNGVYGDNLVHFNIEDVTVIGSGDPNSSNPTNNKLWGSGIVLTNNSIIGSIRRCSARVWEKGIWFKTLPASGSYWSAAIVVDGQGEFSTNMYGMVFGDATTTFTTASCVTIRDTSFQGNFTTGALFYTANSTTFDACYFEGNANYDIDIVGGPAGAICARILNCCMDSDDIGTTNYGTFPYLSKIRVRSGSFCKIHNNDISATIRPYTLITVDAAAIETSIKDNRLNGPGGTVAIANASTSTITADNAPEAPRVATGQLTRTLSTASGSVSYTGLGFKPTSIEFFGAVDTQPERFIGAAGLTNGGLTNRCMTTDSAGANLSSNDCIRLIRSSAGNEQKATLASFDNDGFTLAWVLVGAPPANLLVVNYIARR